jgi:hypothetical protein
MVGTTGARLESCSASSVDVGGSIPSPPTTAGPRHARVSNMWSPAARSRRHLLRRGKQLMSGRRAPARGLPVENASSQTERYPVDKGPGPSYRFRDPINYPSSGDVHGRQLVSTPSLPPENAPLPAQPAPSIVQVAVAETAPPQATPLAQTAAQDAAPPVPTIATFIVLSAC